MSSQASPDQPEMTTLAEGVEITAAAWSGATKKVLTPEAVALVAGLHRQLEGERQALLEARRVWQKEIDGGKLPEYPDRNSEAIRGDWRVDPIPADLIDRRVEITGPVNSAKMVINMLSRTGAGARADTAMLDFEDAMKPIWQNLMDGVLNVGEAAKGSLSHVESRGDGSEGKTYKLDLDDMAVIIVRPRGLHLDEVNLRVDGAAVSGALLDTALTFFHAGQSLLELGKTPNYYVPKTEHYPEAAWWARLFTGLEENQGLKVGTIKATFLIETLPAAFEMEEILFAARRHAAGLNVGRWDKIFSDIKTMKAHPDRVMADRASITMQRPWMESYAKRCVHVCHSRGAFAMGGMAAFTPGKTPEVRQQQSDKVLEDKKWEAAAGHDGCWVSHPYFIGPAKEAFTRQNQLDVLYSEAERYPELLPQSTDPKTMAGLRTNVRVGIAYLNGWRNGIGCVAWDNLMEDLATLEISRTQTWQWLRYAVQLDDGPAVTEELVRGTFAEELEKIEAEARREMAGRSASDIEATVASFQAAAKEAEELFTRKELSDFLTLTSDQVQVGAK